MRLSTLIKDLKIVSFRGGDPEIKGISSNSKQVREGYLFVAIKGEKDDGHRFIGEAIKRGAVAVVEGSRLVISELAVRFYNHPSSKLNLIGITGTNGKTTVSYLIKNILENFGKKVGLLGTINYEIGNRIIPATNTTPDALVLNSYLRDMVKENIDYVVLEVSSHSIAQQRIKGLDFNAGIFTNFGHDHLDYHQTIENYFRVKKSFFENLPLRSKAIINVDDPRYEELIKNVKAELFSYGIKRNADVFVKKDSLSFSLKGSSFILSAFGREFVIESPLITEYDVHNILAAVTFCIEQELPIETIITSLKRFRGVPGRLQRIDCGQDFILFVDYAHTGEALKNVLTNLKRFADGGKLITIFGCGGDRDRQKRAQMGRISSELSDTVILTSDNPRSESPQAIIQDIAKGAKNDNQEVILDREDAIEKGIDLAKKGDIVLIAGKGHEKYQVFKDTVVPFDDVEVARRIILNKIPNLNDQ